MLLNETEGVREADFTQPLGRLPGRFRGRSTTQQRLSVCHTRLPQVKRNSSATNLAILLSQPERTHFPFKMYPLNGLNPGELVDKPATNDDRLPRSPIGGVPPTQSGALW